MWVARDKSNELYLYRTKPIRQKESSSETHTSIWGVKGRGYDDAVYMGKDVLGFEEVYWVSSPQRVTVQLEIDID